MSDLPEPPPGEPAPGDVHAVRPEDLAKRRRYPSTIGGTIYLAILAVTLGGLVVAVVGSWRQGVGWLASALIAAAMARLVFSDEDAGMLKVRSRALDAVLLAGTGGVLILLAATIPNQPG